MRVEDLERELHAARPELEQDFARRLDEWAEAGFPRDRGLGPGLATRRSPAARAWDRLRSAPPRRTLLPAMAVAAAVTVIGVGVSRIESTGGGDDASTSPSATAPPSATEVAPSASAESSKEFQAAGNAAADSAVALPEGGGAEGLARGTDDRIFDATARLTLGAEADEVQDVANDVVSVTDRYDGIVESSQVTTDQAGARASFELELPYKQLQAALTDLSALGDVISRTEGGQDITAHAVRAQKDLAAVRGQIAKARIDLIQADTRSERLVIKSQIQSLEVRADALESEFNGVKRQGRFATVQVEVTSNGPASDTDDGWSLGEAVDDAGRVLEVIAGIGLISLAVMLPLALVGTLAWLAIAGSRRRARDRALDVD